jgi:putative ABC transport system ATP-binding protein
MSRWRGKNLGIVFQFFQLMPTLTLLENVMLPMALCNNCGAVEREKRAMMLLDLVGLANMADKLPAAVSGGQQQSAAIARALANDPPILIADEPTGNLDSRSADEVFEIFTNLVEEGKTILMVTHDPSLAQRTHRTLLLSDGELINPWVAQALPDLSHSHMLWLTHRLKAQTLPAGVSQPAPAFFLVTGGNLEIKNQHNDNGSGKMTLGPGQASGGSLHFLNGNSQHDWRVSTTSPVEILTLDHTDMQTWLANDSSLSQALAKDVLLPGAKRVHAATHGQAPTGDTNQGGNN